MADGTEKDVERLDQRVGVLEERDREVYADLSSLNTKADYIEEKADAVDAMVHGDGGNSGLIARVNTLESKVTMLMWIGALAVSALVGALVLLVREMIA